MRKLLREFDRLIEAHTTTAIHEADDGYTKEACRHTDIALELMVLKEKCKEVLTRQP